MKYKIDGRPLKYIDTLFQKNDKNCDFKYKSQHRF